MSNTDKRWIEISNRTSHDYINGVDKLLDFAYLNKLYEYKIRCPCRNCSNRYCHDRENVITYCIVAGFEKQYKNWTSHGEEYVNLRVPEVQIIYDDEHIQIEMDVHDNMRQMVQEGQGFTSIYEQPDIDNVVQSDESTTKFLKLLKDAETELWEGCEEFTTLSFLVELVHLKAVSKWSNNSFTKLLKLLKREMPKSTKLPTSFKDAFKLAADLGYDYNTWDVCINHCMLFQNATEKHDKCEICGESRYKKQDAVKSVDVDKGNKAAAKKMWYFSLSLNYKDYFGLLKHRHL